MEYASADDVNYSSGEFENCALPYRPQFCLALNSLYSTAAPRHNPSTFDVYSQPPHLALEFYGPIRGLVEDFLAGVVEAVREALEQDQRQKHHLRYRHVFLFFGGGSEIKTRLDKSSCGQCRKLFRPFVGLRGDAALLVSSWPTRLLLGRKPDGPMKTRLTCSFGTIITIRTTVKHMQGKASSVILRPKRRITIDVPSREKPKEMMFVT